MKPLKKTPLNKVHHDLKARMIDFAGWELPVWYSSILEEHRAVRTEAGMFDVSDMGRVGIQLERSGTSSISILHPLQGKLNWVPALLRKNISGNS